jgi:hypothetical protein
MEDFIKMAGRTMGLHIVILAAHDRGEGKMPGTTMSVIFFAIDITINKFLV